MSRVSRMFHNSRIGNVTLTKIYASVTIPITDIDIDRPDMVAIGQHVWSIKQQQNWHSDNRGVVMNRRWLSYQLLLCIARLFTNVPDTYGICHVYLVQWSFRPGLLSTFLRRLSPSRQIELYFYVTLYAGKTWRRCLMPRRMTVPGNLFESLNDVKEWSSDVV